MTHNDPDIRLPSDEWRRANAVADRLPPEDVGPFFNQLAQELRERLAAADRYDAIEIECVADEAITSALAAVRGRLQ